MCHVQCSWRSRVWTGPLLCWISRFFFVSFSICLSLEWRGMFVDWRHVFSISDRFFFFISNKKCKKKHIYSKKRMRNNLGHHVVQFISCILYLMNETKWKRWGWAASGKRFLYMWKTTNKRRKILKISSYWENFSFHNLLTFSNDTSKQLQKYHHHLLHNSIQICCKLLVMISTFECYVQGC